MVNPLFSASRWDWQPHCYVGAKFLGCVVCRCCLKSYWFDNFGFFSEGKLAATLIIPSSWGLPTDVWYARIKHFFWRRCRGFEAPPLRRLQLLQQYFFWHRCLLQSSSIHFFRHHYHQAAARGVSHFQPFSLLLSCLVYFYFVLFVSFIKNRKKLVTCL